MIHPVQMYQMCLPLQAKRMQECFVSMMVIMIMTMMIIMIVMILMIIQGQSVQCFFFREQNSSRGA